MKVPFLYLPVILHCFTLGPHLPTYELQSSSNDLQLVGRHGFDCLRKKEEEIHSNDGSPYTRLSPSTNPLSHFSCPRPLAQVIAFAHQQVTALLHDKSNYYH